MARTAAVPVSLRLRIERTFPMDKALLTMTKITIAATVLLAGYALLVSLPDLKRYIKISTM